MIKTTGRRISAFAGIAAFALMMIGVVGTIQEVSGIPWPVGNQNMAHAINKTYGDWNGYRCWVQTIPGTPPTYATHIAYHTAVDIPADSGSAVLAVLNGYVTDAKAFPDTQAYHGYVSIARTLGGNPSWHYGHVVPDTLRFPKNAPVSFGDTLGFVASFTPSLSNCHLHFFLDEKVGHLTQAVCNPLDSLVPAPSQDAMIFARTPPAGSHPYLIDYVKNRIETVDTTRTLWDVSAQEFSFILTNQDGSMDARASRQIAQEWTSLWMSIPLLSFSDRTFPAG